MYVLPHGLGVRCPAMRCNRIRRGTSSELIGEAEGVDIEEPHVAWTVALMPFWSEEVQQIKWG
jgi:hypothetical protein